MLTRRGWAVAAVAVGGFVMAAWFSARSLNAVVGPALLALAAGWIQLKRTPPPELHTETPGYGFAGESVTASLDFDASRPLVATVRLSAADGLAVDADAVETTVADEPVTFEVDLRDRGVRSVGPVELAAEDVLGVWKRTYSYPVNLEVVVFPTVHRLSDAGELASLHREFGVGGRDRFDQLREYERGDPLRDVHWKSSAKRPDELVVMEFAASENRERVELLAEADGGRMDEVAEATASIAAYLLDAGFAVGLTVPGDRVAPDVGPEHRTELLTLLARTHPGTVGEARRDRADVFVQGPTDADAVHVTVEGRTVTFDQLTGSGGGLDSPGETGGTDSTALADGGWNSVAHDEQYGPTNGLRGPVAGGDRPAPPDAEGSRPPAQDAGCDEE
ncbi:DUF58 domain-containing protein [Halorussus litoreus]|uniref:DUF58 domain-containing protein n=1 Tax=Halorussus litoreus TaxID=1710536 RepID=UPI000E248BBA|nr:DUF58 domain-containing protein [Halorussus litoreus]